MSEFVNVVIPPLSDPLTYRVPTGAEADIDVGSQVVVPLGANRRVNGFVVSKESEAALSGGIKAVHSVVGKDRCFLPEQLEFFRWVADYYGEPLSNVIDVAIPHVIRPKIERTIRLTGSDDSGVRGSLQKRIIEQLRSAGGASSLESIRRNFPGCAPAIKSLSEKGVIAVEDRAPAGMPRAPGPDWAKRDVSLTRVQRDALDKIAASIRGRAFESFLLYGVTGSGKTEIYIEALQYALSLGRGGIIIVPEIALTPQLVSRFQARLGEDIAVLHSGLTKRSRWDAWNDLVTGRKRIAIGARSAIFAPVRNLGLIVVDEEHDSSYKQQEGLRYNARDIAIVRAKLSSAPAVLGSATPSLESYSRAVRGGMTLVSLPVRHESGSRVSVDVVDLNLVKPWEMPSKNISPALHEAVRGALEKKEQIFLLYNRRGFANYFQCDKCETVLLCPNCSVTLTYHQFNHSLVCHYCFLKITPPALCGSCPDTEGATPGTYVLRGSGTERTQEEVSALFPEARVLRLDRDVVSDLESYESILNAVRSGECDVLVGTQMIAKGHDLPNVTLGAVIDCDVGLHMPDFRAGEKVFQLLTQLAGRAGRGERPGRVILQTRVPRHPSVRYTARHDFEGFANSELESRKELQYPPFRRLLRVVISSAEESAALPAAERARRLLDAFVEAKQLPIRILGPAPCPLSKLKTEWRWHILIKSDKASTLVSLIALLREHMPRKKNVKIIHDLDPYDML